MADMRPRFTKVKGVSESRRLPRLGVIRLGLKAKSQSTGKEYPTETDYFVLTDAPGVAKVYGEKPKEIEVMFPINDEEVIFPQALKMYGKTSGLKCHGNGETARYWDEGKKDWCDKTCPCEHQGKDCSIHGVLMFFIPSVTWGGIFQIRTSSLISIKDLNSALDMYKQMFGRISMIPFWITRKPTVMTKDGKSRTHYTLSLEFRGNTKDVMRLQGLPQGGASVQYLLQAPDETDPKAHAVDVIDADGPSEDAYYEEAPTTPEGGKVEAQNVINATDTSSQSQSAESQEDMTKEQVAALRAMMSKGGIQDTKAQNAFFLWQLERVKSKKTKAFAGHFITDFNNILNDYLTKDSPGAVPDFFGDEGQ